MREFYRMYQNAIELMTDRSYETASLQIGYKEFARHYANIPILFSVAGDDSMPPMVIYISQSGAGFKKTEFVKMNRAIEKEIRKYNTPPLALFVSGKKPNKTRLQEIAAINAEGAYELHYFSYNELSINPTKHRFVPRHERLSIEDREELLSIPRFAVENLPKIQVGDRIVKWYGGRIGDVFKITRPNNVTLREIAYRVVIHNL